MSRWACLPSLRSCLAALSVNLKAQATLHLLEGVELAGVFDLIEGVLDVLEFLDFVADGFAHEKGLGPLGTFAETFQACFKFSWDTGADHGWKRFESVVVGVDRWSDPQQAWTMETTTTIWISLSSDNDKSPLDDHSSGHN